MKRLASRIILIAAGLTATALPAASSLGQICPGFMTRVTPEGHTGTSGMGKCAAISLDGTTAVFGAQNDSSGRGGGFVYTRSGDTWTQQAFLDPSGETPLAKVGSSCAISADGNTIALGAPED